MTEDQLEEHSEVLAKLGTSAEGTHLRARMQSACLVSDMESFKVRHTPCVCSPTISVKLQAEIDFNQLPLRQNI